MRIQQAAFKKGKPFLKGALHCHTTRSDGKLSPEEVIRYLHGKGYQFVALTDHDTFNRESPCPDVPVTILAGMEREINLPGAGNDNCMCVHVVGVGHPDESLAPKQEEKVPFYGTGSSVQDAQGMIDQLRGFGLMVHYAHPEWSGTPYREFGKLKGCYAMEVWNSVCSIGHGLDENAAYWDEALAEGNNLWGVAVDDGHGQMHYAHGFTMVSADNDPASILEALKNGEFYASTGPVIEDFYVEDGVAYVKCPDAASIQFRTLYHPMRIFSNEDGSPIREASCRIPDNCRYVRAIVKDKNGHRAWTNPIILR